jgi:hypothetical protein
VFGHEFDVLGLTQQQQQQPALSSQNQSTLFRCAFGNIWGFIWGFIASLSQPVLWSKNNQTMQQWNGTRMGNLSPTNNEWCMGQVSNTIVLVYVTFWWGIVRQSTSFHFINLMHIRAQLLEQMRQSNASKAIPTYQQHNCITCTSYECNVAWFSTWFHHINEW